MECDLIAGVVGAMPVNFNSRTHVECDLEILNGCENIEDFNSRTHVECDDASNCTNYRNYRISTHALTWSATNGLDNP